MRASSIVSAFTSISRQLSEKQSSICYDNIPREQAAFPPTHRIDVIIRDVHVVMSWFDSCRIIMFRPSERSREILVPINNICNDHDYEALTFFASMLVS